LSSADPNLVEAGGGTADRSRGEVDLTERRDEQLLAERVRLGDAVAFEAVFRLYHRELRESARRVVGSRVMAEDVVQDVFLALWTARERIRIGTSLGSYLHRSVRNAAIRRSTRRVERAVSLDELHDASRPPRQPFVALDPSPHDHAEHSLLVDDLARAAATLPPRAREVFTLSRRDHLTTREIATRLSLSPKTVEMHLTRALVALRAVLGKGR
jgi:RNA polymerase sigma-70 factor (ECF subfamily)